MSNVMRETYLEDFKANYVMDYKYKRSLTAFFVIIVIGVIEFLSLVSPILIYFPAILVAIVVPYIYVAYGLRAYEQLFLDFHVILEKLRYRRRTDRMISQQRYVTVDFYFKKSKIFLGLLLFVLPVVVKDNPILSNFPGEFHFILDIISFIGLWLVLSLLGFPEFQNDLFLKTYGHYEEVNNSRKKYITSVSLLLFLAYALYFLENSNITIFGFISYALMAIAFLIIFLLFDSIAVVSFSTRRLIPTLYVSSLFLTYSSIIPIGALYYVLVMLGYTSLNMIAESLFLLLVGGVNITISLLLYVARRDKHTSSVFLNATVSYDQSSIITSIVSNSEIVECFRTVLVPFTVFTYIILSIVGVISIANASVLVYIDWLITLWKPILYALLFGFLSMMNSLYKISRVYLTDLEKTFEETKKIEQRKRKKKAKTKVKEERKESAKSEKMDLDDIVKILDEFESIFEGE